MNYKYKVGEVYLDTEPTDHNDSFMYVMKNIIELDVSIKQTPLYKYSSWSPIFGCFLNGYDTEERIDRGMILLEDYQKAKRKKPV